MMKKIQHFKLMKWDTITEVCNLQGLYPLKDEWMIGYSLETRLVDQVENSTNKW